MWVGYDRRNAASVETHARQSSKRTTKPPATNNRTTHHQLDNPPHEASNPGQERTNGERTNGKANTCRHFRKHIHGERTECPMQLPRWSQPSKSCQLAPGAERQNRGLPVFANCVSVYMASPPLGWSGRRPPAMPHESTTGANLCGGRRHGWIGHRHGAK